MKNAEWTKPVAQRPDANVDAPEETTEGQISSTTSPGFRIDVVLGHPNNRKNWVMHCRALRLDTLEIGPGSLALEQAQKLAIEHVKKLVTRWHTALQDLQ